MNWLKRLLGYGATTVVPAVADAARPLARQIVRAAVQQALAEAVSRTQARHGKDSPTAIAIGAALGELARDVEAYAAE